MLSTKIITHKIKDEFRMAFRTGNIFDITKCPVPPLPRVILTGIISDCSIPAMGIPELEPFCSCPDFAVTPPLSPPAIPCVVTPFGGGGGGECFTPETKILMADGSHKEIKKVIPGDTVQGTHGANTVTATPRFKLGQNKLHGFNGRKPFVTSMHPIKTDKGWANFDPVAYKKHWPADYAKVSQENESKELIKLKPVQNKIAFWKDTIEYETIDNYVEQEDIPDFDVYNLTIDRNQTFIANDIVVHNKGGECFIPSAKVLMADGSHKEIKDVVVGDKVQGISGANTVTALPRFKLGQNKLHGFNGRKPFMTSMHPIKTKKGWANFDPKLFREHWPEDYAQVASENESGDILRLQVGDLVAFWKDKICYEVLDDYVEEENDPEFDVYNLTLDNDRTFIVNGIIAHNSKSPPDCTPPSTGSEKDCCWFMWCPCNISLGGYYGGGNPSPINNANWQPWPQPYLKNPLECPQKSVAGDIDYKDDKVDGELSVAVKGDARAPGMWVRITEAGSAENCKKSKMPGIHGRYWGDVAIVCFCHIKTGSNLSISPSFGGEGDTPSINDPNALSAAFGTMSFVNVVTLGSLPDPCISVMSVGQADGGGFGSAYPAEMHAAIFGSNKWDNPVIQQTLISQETALTDAWDIDKPQILFDADNKISVPGQYVPQDDSLRFPQVPRDSITGVWRISTVMHKGAKTNDSGKFYSVIPKAQPFEVINVELDYALYGGSASSCSQILGLLIKQDDKYFGLTLAPVNTNTWTKYSGKGLTEESFKEFIAPLPPSNAPLLYAESAQPYFHGDAGAICLGLYVATNIEKGNPAPNVGVCIKNVKISVGL